MRENSRMIYTSPFSLQNGVQARHLWVRTAGSCPGGGQRLGGPEGRREGSGGFCSARGFASGGCCLSKMDSPTSRKASEVSKDALMHRLGLKMEK